MAHSKSSQGATPMAGSSFVRSLLGDNRFHFGGVRTLLTLLVYISSHIVVGRSGLNRRVGVGLPGNGASLETV